MYSKEKIAKQCEDLRQDMEEAGVTIIVLECPRRPGHDVHIFTNPDERKVGNVQLNDYVEEECIKHNKCDEWKRLLDDELKKAGL
jgi:hypothetical protein